METTKIGIVGCGNISTVYCRNAGMLENLEPVACADLEPERARERAEEFGIPRHGGPDDVLADPEVEIVVNLTPPLAHAGVAMAAVEAGKSVYNEKPLAVTREEGRALLEAAEKRGVRVGCAPDTFLGAGLQTCRKLIDDGAIGRPAAAAAFVAGRGPERWHPDPAFFYRPGGGPMFDMGPYYLTSLVSLVGPIRRVTGATGAAFNQRTVGSGPKQGQVLPVEVPTHIAGVLDFASGAIGTIIASFDVWAHNLPRIEIYGTEGTLSVPDPNTFRGPVRLRRGGEDEWRQVPLTHGYEGNSRGLGVADMAAAIRSGRPHRASGRMAWHVLDVMHAIHEASREGRHVELETACERPAALPTGLAEGEIDP